MRRIVRTDWSIDGRELRLTERSTIDYVNRRRIAKRRRERIVRFLRCLWQCREAELVPVRLRADRWR